MRVDLDAHNEVDFFSNKRLICREMKKKKGIFTQEYGFSSIALYLQREVILVESSYENKNQGVIGMSLPSQRSFTKGTKENGKFFRNVNSIIGGSGIISSRRLGNSLITQFYISHLSKCLI